MLSMCQDIETDGICTKIVTTELENGVLTKWHFYHLESKAPAPNTPRCPIVSKPGLEVGVFSLTIGGFRGQTPSLLTDRIIGILSATQYPYLASFHITRLPGENRNREKGACPCGSTNVKLAPGPPQPCSLGPRGALLL